MKFNRYQAFFLLVCLLGSSLAEGAYVPFGVSSGHNKERIERAQVTGGASSCSIDAQSGSWVSSATGISDGSECTLTLTSGTFSAQPTCVCSSNTLSAYMCDAQINSASSITTRIIANTGTPTTGISINVICMGPR